MAGLFLASFLPLETRIALKTIAAENKDLSAKWHCKVNWTATEKLHLTWFFFGEVAEERQTSLLCQLEAFFASKKIEREISIVYDSVQAWKAGPKGQLIVLRNKNEVEEVQRLARDLRCSLEGFIAEYIAAKESKRDFVPHITLMRLRDCSIGKLPLIKNIGEQTKEIRQRHGFLSEREIAASSLSKLEELLPIKQNIQEINLVESKNLGDRHEYSVIKSFKV